MVDNKSVCSNLIQMRYGMFDDPRLRFFSWGGISFLEYVKEYEEQMIFFKDIYAAAMGPKFNSKIGEIV